MLNLNDIVYFIIGRKVVEGKVFAIIETTLGYVVKVAPLMAQGWEIEGKYEDEIVLKREEVYETSRDAYNHLLDYIQIEFNNTKFKK